MLDQGSSKSTKNRFQFTMAVFNSFKSGLFQ